jgi:ribosome biogenesis GTPase A
MAKAKRGIAESLKLVDAAVEILDARCPEASRNADILKTLGAKPRLIILSRRDLAEPAKTEAWVRRYRAAGYAVIEADLKSGRGTEKFAPAVRELLREKLEKLGAKGQSGRVIRVMVIGIPNVGKSTFINRIAGRRAAASADRPGVTRGKQWITVPGGIELLDTPGVLPPKIENPEAGEYLAFTGAVRDEILDTEALGTRLAAKLAESYPELLAARYKLEPADVKASDDPLALIARRRGFIVSGGELDMLRAANILLDEFRGGVIGRVTLESADG